MAVIAGIVFTSILLIAAIGDMRKRRIPNWLVGALAALGLGYSVYQAPLAAGFFYGVEGLVVGLALWLPFYALGWLGAGDVKLFSAASAWLGPSGSVEGALIGALGGGILAAWWMIRSRGIRNVMDSLGIAAGSPGVLSPPEGGIARSTLPYGIAIAFGAICSAWIPGILSR